MADDSLSGRTIPCVACGAAIHVIRPSIDRLAQGGSPSVSGGVKKVEIDQRANYGKLEKISYQDFAEKDWEKSAGGDASQVPRWRRFVLALVGLGIICVVATQVFRIGRGAPNMSTDRFNSEIRDSFPQPRSVAESFLYAKSPKERLRWVRDPEKHSAAIYQHFKHSTSQRSGGASLRELPSVEIVDGVITSYHVGFVDGSSRLICVLDEKVYGRRVVDWEAYFRHGSASWNALLSGQVSTAEVRVFAQPVGPAIFLYGNKETRYYEYALTSPDLEQEVTGFVERGTRTGLTLATTLAGSEGRLRLTTKERMTLLIESLRGSHSKRQFTIKSVIAKGWVKTPTNLESRTILPLDAEPKRGESPPLYDVN